MESGTKPAKNFSSGDVRAGRESERWLTVMMRKIQLTKLVL